MVNDFLDIYNTANRMVIKAPLVWTKFSFNKSKHYSISMFFCCCVDTMTKNERLKELRKSLNVVDFHL